MARWGARSPPRWACRGRAELSRGAASRASCKPGTRAGGESALCLRGGKAGGETKGTKRVWKVWLLPTASILRVLGWEKVLARRPGKTCPSLPGVRRARDIPIPAPEGWVELAEAAGLGGLLSLPTAPAKAFWHRSWHWPVRVRRNTDHPARLGAFGSSDWPSPQPAGPCVCVLHWEMHSGHRCCAGGGLRAGHRCPLPRRRWEGKRWCGDRNGAEGEAGKGSRKLGAEMERK